MGNIILQLKKNSYDPFIDYLKGICIVLVILTHCIPYTIRHDIFFPLWGSPAVPIFLIIQVFHTYKKGMDNVKETNYHKIWQRIIKPFFLTELFLIITTLCLRFTTRELDGLFNYFKMIIKFGGGGSGSYYPWIYSQFAIILPLIVPIFRKIKGFKLAVTFILISSTLEIICNVANLPNFIYRILFFRYTMLIYLGYLLATKGYVLNLKTGLLSILSVSSVLLIVYSNLTFSPFLYFDPKWESCHWICYFYIAFLLLFIL